MFVISRYRYLKNPALQDLNNNLLLCFLALCIINTLLNKFFDEIINKYNFFNNLDVKSKILFLFNSIDPFIRKSVAAFIFDIMNCRHDILILKLFTFLRE